MKREWWLRRCYAYLRLLLPIILILCFILLQHPTEALSNLWTSTTPSVFSKYKDSSTNDPMSLTQYTGKSACEVEQVKTKDVLNLLPSSNDTYSTECVTPMSFGGITKSGKIILSSYNRAITIKYNNFVLAPVANTDTVYFIFTGGYNGMRGELRKIVSFGDVMNNYLSREKQVRFALNPQDLLQTSFRDFLNSDIDVFLELYASSTPVGNFLTSNVNKGMDVFMPSLSFSKNGAWAFLQSNGWFYRLSIVTDAVNKVSEQQLDAWNGGSTTITSISNDGSTSSFLFHDTQLTIFDVNNCINQQGNCKKLMTDDLYNGLGSGAWMYRTEFLSLGSLNYLKVWLIRQNNPNRTMEVYHIFPDQTSQDYYTEYKGTAKYLALGDSFSSGEGAFTYKEGTDEPDNKCHQSTTAYSERISQSLNIPWHYSVTCSGAVMDDVLYSVDTTQLALDESFVDPKTGERRTMDEYYNFELKQNRTDKFKEDEHTENILKHFLPGYRQQVRFVEQYQPNIITLSISGNDLGFSDKLKHCLDFDDCYITGNERLEIQTEIYTKFERLALTLKTLKDKSPEDTHIYIIGYPRLFLEDGSDNCGANVLFSKNEQQFANYLVSDINNMIATAARKAGVVYVDIEHSLQDYALCSSGDTKAFNGITPGNDNPSWLKGPVGNESYHPTILGQELMAQAIMVKTNNFTLPMPEPETLLTILDIPTSRIMSSSQTPPTYTVDTVALSKYTSSLSTEDILYSAQPDMNQFKTVINDDLRLPPESLFDLSIHSTPTHLATIKTDSEGNLEPISYSIPQSISYGYHTLHLTGKTIEGRDIDMYKSVFVAYSKEDLDGDGILNTEEDCYTIDPTSYLPIDKSYVDSLCPKALPTDPIEETPPTTTSSSTSPTQTETKTRTASSDVTNYEITANSSSIELPITTQPTVLSKTTEVTTPLPPTQTNHIIYVATGISLSVGLISLLFVKRKRKNNET